MASNSNTTSVESKDPPMTIAQRIDAHFAKVAEEEAEKRLRGESGQRKLIFNPDITPNDKEWVEFKATIIAELPKKSILDILDEQHEVENGDDMVLVPTGRTGAIHKMQRRNAKDYKANLAPGGRFHGQPDNVITKLIMLKFGLPIAPITTNNILYAGDYPDKDDPPDGPEREPRVQRIEFAEKPLEFLNNYNERSYGWKIIRMKTPSQPTSRGVTKSPQRRQLHIRGGGLASPSSSSKPAPDLGGYIYSHLGGRAKVSEDVESFVQASLKLLGIPLESRWKFVVESYNNNIKYQDQPWNPYYPKGPASYSLITKEDTSSWDDKICSRVFHPKGVWRMAVRPADNTPAPEYLWAAIDDGVGKMYAGKPTPAPDNETTAIKWAGTSRLYCEQYAKASGGTETLSHSSAHIWTLDDPHELGDYDWMDVADISFNSFIVAALPRLELDKNDWQFQVGLYVPSLENPEEWIHRSIVELSSKDSLAKDKFEREIAPNLYSPSQQWAALLLLPKHTIPSLVHVPGDDFEGDEDDENTIDSSGNDVGGIETSEENGIDFTNYDGEGSENDGVIDDEMDNDSLFNEPNIVLAFANEEPVTLENNDSFINAVLAQFDQSSSDKWAFSVDRYSCPRDFLTAKHEHTLVFNEKSPVDQFEREILSKSKENSRNWCFVARTIDQPCLPTFTLPETAEYEVPDPDPQGRIYGYAGQINAIHDPQSILEAIHSLLNFDIRTNWSFVVDLHLENVETILTTAKNWSDVYEKAISPSIKEGEKWPIFVRRPGEPVSTSLEPVETVDVIHLVHKEVGIAYWKVPKNMDVGYGINQPQADFRRAMQLFFSGHTCPAKRIYVAGESLGFGSIDLSTALWNNVRKETASSWSEFKRKKAINPADVVRPQPFELIVEFEDSPITRDDTLVVHYVGDAKFGQAPISKMAHTIQDLGRNRVADMELPKGFRIWRSAQDRESEAAGEVFNFGTGTTNVKALENWHHDTSGKPTTCLEFRPEWEKLELIELESDSSNPISWNWDTKSGNSTLRSFYDSIKSHYGDEISIKKQSIEIVEPQSHNRFIVASDTDEKDWRVYVYDWISTTRLQIVPIDDVRYIIDTATPWALPTHLLATFGRKSIKPTPSNSPKPSQPTTGNTQRPTYGIPPPKPVVKFNKDRVDRQFKVTKKAPPPWSEWQAEQEVLDKLQNSTYLAPQPIVEPGLAPDAPLFAESRELAIGASLHTPTAYASVLTPTDARHLREQNRRLLNQVLERTSSCVICNATFEAYKTKEKQEHYNLHRQAIDSAGACVLCEDKNWKFWTAVEKRQHLYQHQARDEGRIAKTFWAGFECPGCDLDLSTLGDKNDVLKHVIAHDSQTVKYCDRCGKSYKSCTAAELSHHDRICIEGPDREPETISPAFCKGCGIDTTSMTEEQDKLHSARALNCFTKDAFCTTCGFDMTGLNPQNRSRHTATCKTPGGLPKTYCCRCGEDFTNLGGNARKDHSKFCKSAMNMEPDIIRHANTRFKELDAQIQINHENDAKRRKASYSLHQREKRVQAEEAALKRKEALFNAKANPFGAYSSQETLSHGIGDNPLGTTFENAPNGRSQSVVRTPIAAAVSTQSTQDIVGTFTCPMPTMSSDGSSSICGQIISLRDGGVELAKHFEHVGSGGHHGPNSVRAKQLYEHMTKKTAEYTDIIKNKSFMPQHGAQIGSVEAGTRVTITTPKPAGPTAGQTGTPPATGLRPVTGNDSDQGYTSPTSDLSGGEGFIPYESDESDERDERWWEPENYKPIINAWDTVRQLIIDHSMQRSARQALAILLGWEIAYKGNQAVLEEIEKITAHIEEDHNLTRRERLQAQLDKDSLGTSYPLKNGKEDDIDDAIITLTNIGPIRTFDNLKTANKYNLDPQYVAEDYLYNLDLDKILDRIEGMEIKHQNDGAALERLASLKNDLLQEHPGALPNAQRQSETPEDGSDFDLSNIIDEDRDPKFENLSDDDDLYGSEEDLPIAPRTNKLEKKTPTPEIVIEISSNSSSSSSDFDISTSDSQSKKKRGPSVDVVEEPASPVAKKQKTVSKTAIKYVPKAKRDPPAVVAAPKRRSPRVIAKGQVILKKAKKFEIEIAGNGKKSSALKGTPQDDEDQGEISGDESE